MYSSKQKDVNKWSKGIEITLEMTSSVPTDLLEINPKKKKKKKMVSNNPNCPAKCKKLSKQSCSWPAATMKEIQSKLPNVLLVNSLSLLGIVYH